MMATWPGVVLAVWVRLYLWEVVRWNYGFTPSGQGCPRHVFLGPSIAVPYFITHAIDPKLPRTQHG